MKKNLEMINFLFQTHSQIFQPKKILFLDSCQSNLLCLSNSYYTPINLTRHTWFGVMYTPSLCRSACRSTNLGNFLSVQQYHIVLTSLHRKELLLASDHGLFARLSWTLSLKRVSPSPLLTFLSLALKFSWVI